MDDPIFIVGLPRSGSTLWSAVIAKNPAVFEIGEMLMLTPIWRRDFRYFLKVHAGDLAERENVRSMINKMFSGDRTPGIRASFWQYTAKSYRNPELEEALLQRIEASDKNVRSIFSAFIEELTAFYGFRRCCVKFPVFVNYVPTLLKWYPNCRIAHITRDPRAMVVSRANFRGERRLKGRRAMMAFTIWQYAWTSRLHVRYRSLDQYALFRYEDLMVDPENTIQQLCTFVGLQFDQEMLHPRGGQPSSVTGVRTAGFDRKAASHWKTMLSPMEARIVTLLTRGSMTRFGYDPDTHPVYQEGDDASVPRPRALVEGGKA